MARPDPFDAWVTMQMRRRALLGGAAGAALTVILAACGDTTTSAPTQSPASASTPASAAPTMAPAATTGSSAIATSAPAMAAASAAPSAPTAPTAPAMARTMPTGVLNVAVGNDFPTKLDALKFSNVSLYGMSEMLNRLTPSGKIEPWLATSVVNVNPTTWRVTLRPDVTFWDGSPLTPDDVIASFKTNWDAYPDANGLVSRDTRITATDTHTLEFVTPQPTGIFPGALTLPLFTIHKPSAPGVVDGALLTGPYKPSSFVADNQLVLEPYLKHWAGVPPIAKITVRSVVDANTRALALQSGDLNAVYGLPPEVLKTLGDGIETTVIPSGRVHFLAFNVNRPPFDDRNVREATALALDRAGLNTVVLDGKGAVATGMFPPNLGFDIVPLQGTDIARAKQLLDGAGWKAGSDGVRVRDGKRLSFTILTYPGRAEIPPLGVAVQGQLKPLGYDIPQVPLLQLSNLTAMAKAGDWDAAIFSSDMFGTGDPLYGLNRVVAKVGGNNLAAYGNPQIESLLTQLRAEIDPAQRQALSRQIQEIVKVDVPMAFLVIPPGITAFKKGAFHNYTPHPSDQFFITSALSVT